MERYFYPFSFTFDIQRCKNDMFVFNDPTTGFTGENISYSFSGICHKLDTDKRDRTN